jgi:hypothetical protein
MVKVQRLKKYFEDRYGSVRRVTFTSCSQTFADLGTQYLDVEVSPAFIAAVHVYQLGGAVL